MDLSKLIAKARKQVQTSKTPTTGKKRGGKAVQNIPNTLGIKNSFIKILDKEERANVAGKPGFFQLLDLGEQGTKLALLVPTEETIKMLENYRESRGRVTVTKKGFKPSYTYLPVSLKGLDRAFFNCLTREAVATSEYIDKLASDGKLVKGIAPNRTFTIVSNLEVKEGETFRELVKEIKLDKARKAGNTLYESFKVKHSTKPYAMNFSDEGKARNKEAITNYLLNLQWFLNSNGINVNLIKTDGTICTLKFNKQEVTIPINVIKTEGAPLKTSSASYLKGNKISYKPADSTWVAYVIELPSEGEANAIVKEIKKEEKIKLPRVTKEVPKEEEVKAAVEEAVEEVVEEDYAY